jgi:hypothetical protein
LKLSTNPPLLDAVEIVDAKGLRFLYDAKR